MLKVARVSGLALLGACVVGLTACGNSQDDAVRTAVDGFYDALAAGEGERACVPLAPATRSELEQSSGKPCAQAILEEDVPEVDDPERFGVPEIVGDRIVRIEEKPRQPRSGYAVTGVYVYDSRVFEIIRGLDRSARGELEITDVNNRYIEWDALSYGVVDGWWTDAGTFESLHRASTLVREMREADGAPEAAVAGAESI